MRDRATLEPMADRTSSRRIRWLPVLALLSGCATPVQLYEGPRRADDEVALVSTAGSATMLQIDGRIVDPLESLFALEPGTHVLLFRARRTHLDFGVSRASIEASSLAPQITTHCFVTLELEPGHRYEVVSAIWDARKVEDPSAITPDVQRDHRTVLLAGLRDATADRLVEDVRCDYDERPGEGVDLIRPEPLPDRRPRNYDPLF